MKWLYLLQFIYCQEHFSSAQDMIKLVGTEKAIINNFEGLLAKKQYELDQVKLLFKKSKEKVITVEQLKHPMNQFLIIRRFTKDIRLLMDEFNMLTESETDFGQYQMPNNEDLQGAIDGILRLQDTYNLKTEELVSGSLGFYDTDDLVPQLTADECFDIGFQAYSKQDYYHSSLWMNSAWKLVVAGDNSMGNGLTVLDYLAFSVSQEGNHEQARNLTLLLHENYPDEPRYRDNLAYYDMLDNVIHRPSSSEEVDYNTLDTEDFLTRPAPAYPEKQKYEELCREETIYAPDIIPRLHCFYWHGRENNNFLAWAPVKTEVLYPDPLVVQFYDVISDYESQQIRYLATRQLKRATIRDPQTGILRTAEYRVQKTTWLTEDIVDDYDQIVKKFNRRIGDITGLDMSKAELLQMGSYGVGGQYEPHWDHQAYPGAENQWENEIGSRIATWLTYLTTPERGGKTCFLDLDIAAKPTRNSAVFWYNHLPSGASDDRTRHAACPVLIGSKWVSNKWIHERGQELGGRSCGLNEHDSNVRL